MQRSRTPYVFLAIAAALAISAIVTLILKPGSKPSPSTGPTPPPTPQSSSATNTTPTTPEPDSASTTPPTPTQPAAPTARPNDPAALIAALVTAIESGNLNAIQQLATPEIIPAADLPKWQTLLQQAPKTHQPNGVREVGELELNQRSRWAIHLDTNGKPAAVVFADLRRNAAAWSLDALRLTSADQAAQADPAQADGLDPLAVADAFLQAVLRQDFAAAKRYSDPASLTDAKIAGLCILFEEGKYRLRQQKPLRAMFQRTDACGFLAHVETPDAGQPAQFALTLNRKSSELPWKVAEINLDRLLADYAQRVAGGDEFYSPLVKNPSGGETLAVYFGFDEDQMSPRTQRQLEIVSRILMADPVKKITLSGHTDALGTDPYNRELSARRAVTVKEFLLQSGVRAGQIVTEAKGATQPRRPNVTETGQDNPEGRRANRRTEIYLDF